MGNGSEKTNIFREKQKEMLEILKDDNSNSDNKKAQMGDHALFSGLDAAEEGTSELEGMCENPRKPKSTKTEKRTEHPRTTGQPEKVKHTGKGSGHMRAESLQSYWTL